MKRKLSLLLCVALLFNLCSCGNKEQIADMVSELATDVIEEHSVVVESQSTEPSAEPVAEFDPESIDCENLTLEFTEDGSTLNYLTVNNGNSNVKVTVGDNFVDFYCIDGELYLYCLFEGTETLDKAVLEDTAAEVIKDTARVIDMSREHTYLGIQEHDGINYHVIQLADEPSDCRYYTQEDGQVVGVFEGVAVDGVKYEDLPEFDTNDYVYVDVETEVPCRYIENKDGASNDYTVRPSSPIYPPEASIEAVVMDDNDLMDKMMEYLLLISLLGLDIDLSTDAPTVETEESVTKYYTEQ